MKDKLKMLFAYFRGTKSEDVYVHYWFDDSTIDDRSNFTIRDNKQIEPARFVSEITDELVKLYTDYFLQYVNLGIDSTWSLDVNIRPFDNTLFFTSEHKQQFTNKRKKSYDINDLSIDVKNIIERIYDENENLTKIEIQFSGSDDEGEIYRVEFDNKKHNFDDDEDFWLIVNNVMKYSEGDYWYSVDSGCEGDVTIWGDDIFVYYLQKYEEYTSTEMNIEVTPENVIE